MYSRSSSSFCGRGAWERWVWIPYLTDSSFSRLKDRLSSCNIVLASAKLEVVMTVNYSQFGYLSRWSSVVYITEYLQIHYSYHALYFTAIKFNSCTLYNYTATDLYSCAAVQLYKLYVIYMYIFEDLLSNFLIALYNFTVLVISY